MRRPGGQANRECTSSARELPSVDRILHMPEAARFIAEHGHTLVAKAVRDVLADARSRALSGGMDPAALRADALLDTVRARIDARLIPRLRSLLNLTGTVIHTNFGRALLCDSALHRLLEVMRAPCNLEYDLSTGRRGDRDTIVEELLCTITGAEAATVVNNNAAAVLLTIAALAQGREVIVSRGELVEIGGAFRMPDVMAAAGAKLVEVGTTNRTHRHDYELAVNERTALLLKVHTSNYAINGFTASVCERELAEVAHSRGLTLACDLGAGSLVDLSLYGMPHEPTPHEKLAAGCDVVSFSADKLLGGPQAGLIVGSRSAIERIRRFPMKRALRVGKLTLAALEATLQVYLRPERLAQDLPTLRLLTRPEAAIRALAEKLLPTVAAAVAPRFTVQVVTMMGQIGSGSLPVELLASAGLSIAPVCKNKRGRALDTLACALRRLPLPVIGRIAEDKLLLDLRCLEDETLLVAQLPLLKQALQ